MPSGWPSMAASRWSGVTSGLWAARARSTAAANASWVLSVQRSGSSVIGYLPSSCMVRRAGRVGTGVWDSGTRSRRYWRWVRPPPRGPRPGWPPARRSRATSASSSRTRRTPSRLSPALVRLLDAAQPVDVVLAVAPAAALGAARVEQALALVDAQGLGVHAGQLGGHRDDVDGPGSRIVAHLTLPVRRAPVGRPPAASASTAARCSSVSVVGHGHLDGDQQVAGRALPPAGTPRPLTRKVRPDGRARPAPAG